jgi:hypothetical protein
MFIIIIIEQESREGGRTLRKEELLCTCSFAICSFHNKTSIWVLNSQTANSQNELAIDY